MWIDIAGASDEPTLVVTDPWDGARVIIGGADDLYALVIVANAALPDTDTRKISVQFIEALARAVETDGVFSSGCGDAVRRLVARLSNLLPPSQG